MKVNKLLGNLVKDPSVYADFEFLAFWQTQYNNMNAVNLFFAWIKVKPHQFFKLHLIDFFSISSKPSCGTLHPYRYSNTSVLIRQCHSCPPRWHAAPQTSWALLLCSSLCFLPMPSWAIYCLVLRLKHSAHFKNACKYLVFHSYYCSHCWYRFIYL